MIKAIFLILEPAVTWDRVVLAQRSLVFILGRYLLPMLLILVAVKGVGLVEVGKWQAATGRIKVFTVNQAVVYETMQLLSMLLVVALCAQLVKVMGESLQTRQASYTQAFTLICYGLSPLYLLQLLGVLPGVSPWVPWGIGLMLSLATLYYGLPRVLRTDPTNAFSLHLMSALLIVTVTGFKCFLTVWYLSGRFPALDHFISAVAAALP